MVITAGCATQRKVIVKSTDEEISDLELMMRDVGDKDWNSRMNRMKEGITDQLKRTVYGMETGKITSAEGAEIIAKAQDVIDKMDDIAKNAGSNSGEHRGGHRGSGGGGFGGGGWGGSGGMGVQNDNSGTSDDSGQHHGQPKDFLELKDMIDNYFSNTVTASVWSASVTGTAVPEGTNNPDRQVPGSK